MRSACFNPSLGHLEKEFNCILFDLKQFFGMLPPNFPQVFFDRSDGRPKLVTRINRFPGESYGVAV